MSQAGAVAELLSDSLYASAFSDVNSKSVQIPFAYIFAIDPDELKCDRVYQYSTASDC